MITMVVARNIRALMTDRRVTQVELARVLHISQQAVSSRLRGITPWDVNELGLAAQALNVSPGQLLDGNLLPHLDLNQEPFANWLDLAA